MGKIEAASPSFPDHGQNYWQLASIQAASEGLPGMLIGKKIASEFGVGKAVSSIIIGNLLLWMVGLAIISMSAPSRYNAIENAKKYLGKTGGILSAIFLIIAFLSWYILQINSSIAALNNLIPMQGTQLRWGAALAVMTALLSLGGIHLIKKFNVMAFPIIFCFISYLSYQSFGSFQIDTFWEFSFIGTITIFAIILPGMVNLPTFFRHSRSQADSYLGLSLMVIFTILFQLSTVVANFENLYNEKQQGIFDLAVWIAFIIISLIAVNLVNIYFAAAGWEMILPHRRSPKEYAIVGLMGTMAYTFLQISAPMEFLETMANNFIATLAIVLMLGFLVRIVVRHRPRPLEQLVNVSCWLFGGTIGTIIQSQNTTDPTQVLIIAMSSSCIAFISLIFIEETVWALKKII